MKKTKLLEIFIIILITIVVILVVWTIYKNANKPKRIEVTASSLIPNDNGDAALKNVIELQKYVDEVANSGGGIVHIPKGTYYFKVDPSNKAQNWATTGHNCHYAIWCRDNVLIEGEGIDETILKPYGTYPHGLNMFHYATVFDEIETGVTPVYLNNADFKNFTINSDEEQYINPQSSAYKAMGKGFMLAPIKKLRLG